MALIGYYLNSYVLGKMSVKMFLTADCKRLLRNCFNFKSFIISHKKKNWNYHKLKTISYETEHQGTIYKLQNITAFLLSFFATFKRVEDVFKAIHGCRSTWEDKRGDHSRVLHHFAKPISSPVDLHSGIISRNWAWHQCFFSSKGKQCAAVALG